MKTISTFVSENAQVSQEKIFECSSNEKEDQTQIDKCLNEQESLTEEMFHLNVSGQTKGFVLSK